MKKNPFFSYALILSSLFSNQVFAYGTDVQIASTLRAKTPSSSYYYITKQTSDMIASFANIKDKECFWNLVQSAIGTFKIQGQTAILLSESNAVDILAQKAASQCNGPVLNVESAPALNRLRKN